MPNCNLHSTMAWISPTTLQVHRAQFRCTVRLLKIIIECNGVPRPGYVNKWLILRRIHKSWELALKTLKTKHSKIYHSWKRVQIQNNRVCVKRPCIGAPTWERLRKIIINNTDSSVTVRRISIRANNNPWDCY